MDKSWITKSRWTREYTTGVDSFLEFADKSKNVVEKILCPCKSCINRYFYSMKDVKVHLLSKGFFPGYVVWTRHGEEHQSMNDSGDASVGNEPIASVSSLEELPVQAEQPSTDDMEGLLRDTFGLNNVPTNLENECAEDNADPPQDQNFSKLLEDAGAELYPGCKSFCRRDVL